MWLSYISTILLLVCVTDTSCCWGNRRSPRKRVTPTTTTPSVITDLVELQKLTTVSSTVPTMERNDHFAKPNNTTNDHTPGSTKEDHYNKGIMQTTSAITDMAALHEHSTESKTNITVERNDNTTKPTTAISSILGSSNDDRYNTGIMQTTSISTDMVVTHELTTVSRTNDTPERNDNIVKSTVTTNDKLASTNGDDCAECIMQTTEGNLPKIGSHVNDLQSDKQSPKSLDRPTVTLVICLVALAVALVVLLIFVLRGRYTKNRKQSLHSLDESSRSGSFNSLIAIATATGGQPYENIVNTSQPTHTISICQNRITEERGEPPKV